MFLDRFLIENCPQNDLTVAQKDVELVSKNWSGSGGCPGPHFGGIFNDFRVDFGVILESFFNVFLCWNPLVSWWRCYGIALVLL